MALSVEVWPRRKYEISRDANPFPTGRRPLPEAYGKLARTVETSRECQISKRSLQISVQINYYPHGRRASPSLSLFLLYASVLASFSCWNPSLPRFHLPLLPPPLHVLRSFPQDSDTPTFHIDDHPPSTAKTSHFARDAEAAPDV